MLQSPMTSSQFPVVMTKGSHLFPYRTQQLSPSVPMVLGWRRPGRVGRCRNPFRRSCKTSSFFCCDGCKAGDHRSPLQSAKANKKTPPGVMLPGGVFTLPGVVAFSASRGDRIRPVTPARRSRLYITLRRFFGESARGSFCATKAALSQNLFLINSCSRGS